eukprot:2276777-Rhodomonas_salina.1
MNADDNDAVTRTKSAQRRDTEGGSWRPEYELVLESMLVGEKEERGRGQEADRREREREEAG